MIAPGTMLSGRYRMDERIAGGGMGDVWRGTDETLGRTVAIKIMLPALMDEPGFAERFRQEARTMATIKNPSVVDIYDYGSDQNIAYLVMEYVEGDPLSRTLGRVGRLTPTRTMALIAQAADALQAAHSKGIVHRDVKPGNLLVRANGTLVLTDFGIARSAVAAQLTAAGAVLGTASYLAPEQAAGQTATALSDIYALGVVAYQCLSGRRPFEGDNPIEIAMKHVREHPPALPGDVPPAVRAIVERAMAKDPAARWPTAAILAATARQAATALGGQQSGRAAPTVPHRPISPTPVSPTPVPPQHQRPVQQQPSYQRAQVPVPNTRPTSGPPVSPARPGSPAPTSPARPAQPQNRPQPTQPDGAGSRTFVKILLLFLAMTAIVLISCVIGYQIKMNALPDSANHANSRPLAATMSMLTDPTEGRRTR
ncbi:serine/threonine-protein kinase [Allocatelliglobosispora scoriae]|uniref:non-specific serine/threonine protein kinase n=1 Tax=Allocatelliglobosispora scoriae TaxID=643052 RepID=A0A841BUE4_9ACTN|nr:serine/threonine-protein kinase [Allocatelliglobosispora scoriae]MBB5871068.1 serine/threonine-protein kinase [Allocatelliglobosispora scoriae]